jgi:hypothetical protein
MSLKLMLQPWMTVIRTMEARAGFRNSEDAKRSAQPRSGAAPTRDSRVRRTASKNQLERLGEHLERGAMRPQLRCASRRHLFAECVPMPALT